MMTDAEMTARVHEKMRDGVLFGEACRAVRAELRAEFIAANPSIRGSDEWRYRMAEAVARYNDRANGRAA